MLRLLIVDDEYLVCELIKKLIHFDELGIRLVGQANDGETALQMITELQPDIVVMDIRMPELDGLEIVKRICEAGMDVKFVMVSGHKQWDYAFGAIKYGVEDYLLKPINENEINSVLARIVQRHQLDNENSKKGEQLRLRLADSEKQLRVHFMENLLRGDVAEYDLGQINQSYRFHFVEGFFTVVTIMLDMNKRTDSIDSLKRSNIFKKMDKTLQKAIMQAGAADCECCILGNCMVLLVNSTAPFGMNACCMQDIYNKALGAVDAYDDFDVILCAGSAVSDLRDIPFSLATARAAACDRSRIGTDRVVQAGSIRFMQPDEIGQWMAAQMQNGLKKEVFLACEIASSIKLSSCLAKFFAAIDRDGLPANAALEVFHELVQLFQAASVECGYNKDAIMLMSKRLCEEIYEKTSIKAIEKMICDRLCEYLDTRYNIMSTQKIAPIRMAQEYISAHYNENISLSTISELVHLNPVYFSALFKNETGQNFTDYIISVRMEMAKKELETNARSIDMICEAIGYRDRKYFGQLFKKHVGLTPSEYRKLKS
ncbi:MAG: response regulator [Christensenellales bacterium]